MKLLVQNFRIIVGITLLSALVLACSRATSEIKICEVHDMKMGWMRIPNGDKAGGVKMGKDFPNAALRASVYSQVSQSNRQFGETKHFSCPACEVLASGKELASCLVAGLPENQTSYCSIHGTEMSWVFGQRQPSTVSVVGIAERAGAPNNPTRGNSEKFIEAKHEFWGWFSCCEDCLKAPGVSVLSLIEEKR